jgi:hypothetical protein
LIFGITEPPSSENFPFFAATLASAASLLAACAFTKDETVGIGGFLGSALIRVVEFVESVRVVACAESVEMVDAGMEGAVGPLENFASLV